MQRIFLLALGLLFSASAFAQSCNTIIPLDDGLMYEYTYYNKKGKIESRQVQKVTFIEEQSNGLLAQMETTLYEKKDKEPVMTSTFDILCEDDKLTIDMEGLYGQMIQGMSAGGSMEVDIESTGWVIPKNLAVGSELPDANMTMSMSMGGLGNMNTSVDVVDRKVTGKETITTPSGTYDCFVLESTTKVKSVVKLETTSKDWLCPGVGIVQSETYRKGKVDSKMMMTKFEQ